MSSDPPGWPGDDAARDGAPLDATVGGGDPRLVAAERVIRQLRLLVAALAAERDLPVVLTGEQLADPRLRHLRIQATSTSVRLLLPEPDPGREAGAGNRAQAAEGEQSDVAAANTATGPASGSRRAGDGQVRRAGDSALMRRLAQVAAEHAQPADSPGSGTETE